MDSTKEIAEQFYVAEKSATPVEALTVANPGLTVEQAYAIQLAGVAIRQERDSRRIVGKKIGLTSIAMQKLIGVDSPDYGHLFDHMLVPDGWPISCSRTPAAQG